jgi:hypothetical protein
MPFNRPMTGQKSTFLHLHTHLSLALCDNAQAETIAHDELLKRSCVLVGVEIERKKWARANESPATLEEIFVFDECFNTCRRYNHGAEVVVYTGLELENQIKVVFLLCCHLIMTCYLHVYEVLSFFKAVDNLVGQEENEVSLRHYWLAFRRAKELQWINFSETFDTHTYGPDCIAMDEYLHYARCCVIHFLTRVTPPTLRVNGSQPPQANPHVYDLHLLSLANKPTPPPQAVQRPSLPRPAGPLPLLR